MTLCNNIQQFSRTHERIADFFSLLAVVLLFASVWATVEYHGQVLDWLRRDLLLNGALLVGALLLNNFLILGFLTIGSARFGEPGERCFGTFRGRRNNMGRRTFGVFGLWLDHMENVGKKHR